MKKYIMIILTMILCLSLLTACGSEEKEKNSWMKDYLDQNEEENVDQYNKQDESLVEVEVVEESGDVSSEASGEISGEKVENTSKEDEKTKNSTSEKNKKKKEKVVEEPVETEEDIFEKRMQTLKQNVIVNKVSTLSNQPVVFVRNDNFEALNITLEVKFYDESGRVIEMNTYNLNGFAGKTGTYLPLHKFEAKTYDHYDFVVKIDSNIPNTVMDKVSIKSKESGKTILVQVTNNSSSMLLRAGTAIIFYKDSLVTAVDYGEAKMVIPGNTNNILIKLNDNDKDYDYYETYLTEAFVNN